MTQPEWSRLYAEYPEPLVGKLKEAFERGSIAFTAAELAAAASTTSHKFTAEQAQALLEIGGDWLVQEPIPGEVDPEFPDETPPPQGVRFVWRGEPRRTTAWLLLVHGMNTKGLWQQYLSFDLVRRV